MTQKARTALIVGASSGIGEALARQMATEGWRIVLLARRMDRLQNLADELGHGALAYALDVSQSEAAADLIEYLMRKLDGVDLVVISAGIGEFNRSLEWQIDRDTFAVNILGFAAVAQAAMRHFMERGRGHLVGITSIAALRGNGGTAAYAASKAFESVYLDSLRDTAKKSKKAITITEIQPGFVDTPMMKSNAAFWVASPEKAARQILAAIHRRAKHAYVTRRWGLIALLLRLMPRPG